VGASWLAAGSHTHQHQCNWRQAAPQQQPGKQPLFLAEPCSATMWQNFCRLSALLGCSLVQLGAAAVVNSRASQPCSLIISWQ
jgi:hypothetical protein